MPPSTDNTAFTTLPLSEAMQAKLTSAMIYPLLLVCTAIGALASAAFGHRQQAVDIRRHGLLLDGWIR